MGFDLVGAQLARLPGNANETGGEPLSSSALANSSSVNWSITHAAPLIVRVNVVSGIKTLPVQSSRTS
jgi:hypothetical protein